MGTYFNGIYEKYFNGLEGQISHMSNDATAFSTAVETAKKKFEDAHNQLGGNSGVYETTESQKQVLNSLSMVIAATTALHKVSSDTLPDFGVGAASLLSIVTDIKNTDKAIEDCITRKNGWERELNQIPRTKQNDMGEEIKINRDKIADYKNKITAEENAIRQHEANINVYMANAEQRAKEIISLDAYCANAQSQVQTALGKAPTVSAPGAWSGFGALGEVPTVTPLTVEDLFPDDSMPPVIPQTNTVTNPTDSSDGNQNPLNDYKGPISIVNPAGILYVLENKDFYKADDGTDNSSVDIMQSFKNVGSDITMYKKDLVNALLGDRITLDEYYAGLQEISKVENALSNKVGAFLIDYDGDVAVEKTMLGNLINTQQEGTTEFIKYLVEVDNMKSDYEHLGFNEIYNAGFNPKGTIENYEVMVNNVILAKNDGGKLPFAGDLQKQADTLSESVNYMEALLYEANNGNMDIPEAIAKFEDVRSVIHEVYHSENNGDIRSMAMVIDRRLADNLENALKSQQIVSEASTSLGFNPYPGDIASIVPAE